MSGRMEGLQRRDQCQVELDHRGRDLGAVFVIPGCATIRRDNGNTPIQSSGRSRVKRLWARKRERGRVPEGYGGNE